MKKDLRGFGRSFVAALLMLCMLFGILAPTVLAAEAEANKTSVLSDGGRETLNYVSIGDSMTNGYGFTGYNQGEDDLDFLSGEGVYGNDAYPLQIEKWLEGQGYDVNHAKLAISAMRAEDFLYLLGGRDEPQDGWNDQASNYANCDTPEKLQQLKDYISESVKNADLITMGLGNASFGAYLLQGLTDALGIFGGSLDGDEIVTLEDALIGLDDQQKAVVLQVYDSAMTELYGLVPEETASMFNLDTICDIVAYTVAGFILNYKSCVEMILEMNPDVNIVIVGLMNTTYGIEISLPGAAPIPVGDMMDEFIGILNTYTASVAAALKALGRYDEAEIFFAEQPEPKFICQQFGALKDAGWAVVDRLDGAIVRDRNIDSYNSDLRWLLSGGITAGLNGMRASYGYPALDYSIELPEIDMADVVAFEQGSEAPAWTAHYYQNFLNTLGQEPPSAEDLKMLSVAVYLGMEAAFAESADENSLPLDGLIKLATDMNSVLGGVSLDITLAPELLVNNITEAFVSDDSLRGLCKVYALFKVGNGMSVHPTPAGHDDVTKSVISAIEENKTALMYAVNSLIGYVGDIYALFEDDIIAEIEKLEAKLDEIEAAVRDHIIDKTPELEAAVSEIKGMLSDAYKKLDDWKNGLISQIPDISEISSVIEELASAFVSREYDKLAAAVESMKEAVDLKISEAALAVKAAAAELEAIIPQIGSIVNAAMEKAAELEAMARELSREVADTLNGFIDTARDFAIKLDAWAQELPGRLNELIIKMENAYFLLTATLDQLYDNAVKAVYKVDEDNSYYVALGDSVLALAPGYSYADLLDEYLQVGFKDLSEEGNIFMDLAEVIEQNYSDIAMADIITVGYSNLSAVEFAKSAIITGGAEWKALFGEEVARTAEKIISEVEAIVVSEIYKNYADELGGITEDNLATIVNMVREVLEAYIYANVSQILTFSAVIDMIRSASPDALVVIVGAYNAYENASVSINGVKVNVGVYFDYVTRALNLEALGYALFNENTIYVDAFDVETVIESKGDTLAAEELADYLALIEASYLVPSMAGHRYIFDQIISAVEIIPACKHEYDAKCDADCNICGEERIAAPHTYDNACDAECNICMTERTPSDHVFSNVCDTDCNACGEVREASAHVWGSWTTVRNATDTAYGIKERVCSACADKQTELIPLLTGSSDADNEEEDNTGVIVAITIPSVIALGAGSFSVVWFGVKKKSFGALVKAVKGIFVRG